MQLKFCLDFEKPIADLEARLASLRTQASENDPDNQLGLEEEIHKLESKISKFLDSTYAKLSPWQKCQVARHPDRPHAHDYIEALIDEPVALSGDRLFSEDSALIAGLGKFENRSIAFLGQEKGSSMEQRLHHNFGMLRPEGYRKAQRIMTLAERFNLPIISFVDTPGAYPGIGAEERGQAEAIAKTIQKSLQLKVPIISVVIGEGGSGGAVALATANRVNMLEHAIYSVISPEGCASILWRSAEKIRDAADALGLTAKTLAKLDVVDHVIAEPIGGAHRNPKATIDETRKTLAHNLQELARLSPAQLLQQRRERFLQFGGDKLA